MTQATAEMIVDQRDAEKAHLWRHGHHLSSVDKGRALVAYGVAIGLFVTIGWLALRPIDPYGPVSLVSLSAPLAKWAEALGLAIVASAVSAIIVGSRLPDVGIFAAALGLGSLSLRGGTTTELFADHIASGGEGVRSLAWWMMLESWGWWLVIVAAALASRWAIVWSLGADHESAKLSAFSECESARVIGRDGGDALLLSRCRDGLTHTLITTVVAVFLIRFFVAGDSAGWVRQGQAVFAVVAGGYLGTRTAHHFMPVRTAFWSLLSIPLISLAAFGWVMLRGAPDRPIYELPSVPPSSFLRILPLTYVAIAAAAIVYASWSHRRDAVQAEAARDQAVSEAAPVRGG